MPDTAVEVPLPGMPPGPLEFTDEEIREHAAGVAAEAIYEAAESPHLWGALPGNKDRIRQADVDRLRTAVLQIADEVRDRV